MLPRPTATTYMETLNTQACRSPDNLILRLVTFKSTVMGAGDFFKWSRVEHHGGLA